MYFYDPLRVEYLGDIRSLDVCVFTFICLSIIFHTLCYYFLSQSLNPLIKSYVVSTVHAIICVLSVINFFFRYSIDLKQMNRIVGAGVYGTGDEVMIYSICYSLGYFLYDLFLMLHEKSVRSNAALIHHTIIIFGMFSGIINGVCRSCHFYLLMEELSTIPLNLKAIYHNQKHFHQLFSYLFVFSFFLCRLIYGSIICGYAFQFAPEFIQLASKQNDSKSIIIGFSQIALCLATRTLNLYWAYLILRKIFHLQKANKPKDF